MVGSFTGRCSKFSGTSYGNVSVKIWLFAGSTVYIQKPSLVLNLFQVIYFNING